MRIFLESVRKKIHLIYVKQIGAQISSPRWNFFTARILLLLLFFFYTQEVLREVQVEALDEER